VPSGGRIASAKAVRLAAIQRALEATTAAERATYEESPDVRQVIALEWLRVLHATSTGEPHSGTFRNWIASQNLRTGTLIDLCRYAARAEGFGAFAMEVGAAASAALDASQEDAGTRIDAYLRLARAVVVVSKGEAHAYFHRGAQVASRIGDENISRWIALLDLATAAAEQRRVHAPHIDSHASRSSPGHMSKTSTSPGTEPSRDWPTCAARPRSRLPAGGEIDGSATQDTFSRR